MLLTHSCIALSTLFNIFPLTNKAKLPTNKEQSILFKTALTILLMLNKAGDMMQSVPFKTALTMVLILMLNKAGDRILPVSYTHLTLPTSGRV